ncbi:MAG: helix-turn-helix domain-containing protein [Flavobacteriaceae bacterium]
MKKFKTGIENNLGSYEDSMDCYNLEGINHNNIDFMRILNEIHKKLSLKETMRDEEAIWTSKEVCKILDISKRTLDQYCYNGEISFYKPKKKRMFKQSDIDAFLQKGKRILR